MEKQIKAALESLKTLHRKSASIEEEAMAKIEKILSPRQLAQYILLSAEFRREVWQMMHREGPKRMGEKPRRRGEE
jgi:hypothetical protein